MERAWFRLFPKDLLADTEHLTNEEFGAYVRLLCQEWIEGELPTNDRKLSKMSRARGRWNRIKEEVLTFFVEVKSRRELGSCVNHTKGSCESTALANPRLERERENAINFIKSRRVSGSKGGKKTQASARAHAKASAKAELKRKSSTAKDGNVEDKEGGRRRPPSLSSDTESDAADTAPALSRGASPAGSEFDNGENGMNRPGPTATLGEWREFRNWLDTLRVKPDLEWMRENRLKEADGRISELEAQDEVSKALDEEPAEEAST